MARLLIGACLVLLAGCGGTLATVPPAAPAPTAAIAGAPSVEQLTTTQAAATSARATAAPPVVVGQFQDFLWRAVESFCDQTRCGLTAPGAIAVTGTPDAWDVAVTYDTSAESMADPTLSAVEGMAGYAHTAYAVFHAGPPVRALDYQAIGTLKDPYGNPARQRLFSAAIAGDTAARVNWSGEGFAAFLALSQVTWQNQAARGALAVCAAPCWPRIMPTDFICDPVRLGMAADAALRSACP